MSEDKRVMVTMNIFTATILMIKTMIMVVMVLVIITMIMAVIATMITIIMALMVMVMITMIMAFIFTIIRMIVTVMVKVSWAIRAKEAPLEWFYEGSTDLHNCSRTLRAPYCSWQ